MSPSEQMKDYLNQIDTWKMTLTFDEIVEMMGGTEKEKERLKTTYQQTDEKFRLFVNLMIEQSFLLGKLQGGEEVKNMISAFLKKHLGLDFLDHLKLN